MVAYAQYISDARIKTYVRALENQGYRVDVIALGSEGESREEKLRSGSVYRVMEKYQGGNILLYALSYLRFFLKTFFFLFGRSYNVVHVHNMPNVLIFACLMQKMFGARLILDVHDLMTVNYAAKFNGGEDGFGIKLLKLEQRISASLADCVLCADDNQREYLIEHCGIPAHRVSVMMNLPNLVMSGPAGSERADGTFRLVYHGTIAHRLGVDLIIRAVALAARRIPVELWIYGAGDYLDEVVALASELGVENIVHFSRRFFPVEDIPRLVSGMNAGIIGNRRNTACEKYMLPVKLLEYVHLALPVIAPRLNIIRRYFDESMVEFFEPEDIQGMAQRIVALWKDPERRAQLVANARRFYDAHNMEEQSRRYLNVIAGESYALPAHAPGR
jgi:glycosyltransferase involved in cell wall biosynthesis